MGKKKKATQSAAAPSVEVVDNAHWLAADKDYSVALIDNKLACRNPKGKQLASVPKWLKDSDVGQQLLELRDWLDEHAMQCKETVETWMLRSLPTPLAVLSSIWPDATWRSTLENTVVSAVVKGELQQENAGFLRDVDGSKGVGIIDLDGETQWLETNTIAITHPILLDELDDFREMSAELNLTQSTDQLFRQTWSRPEQVADEHVIREFEGGRFEQLNFALGHCRRLGYRVRGGNACCGVWEDGRMTEARFWVGADYPEGETWTGELMWVDDREARVPIESLGAVTYSEGMRMAAAIYAKRAVEKDDE